MKVWLDQSLVDSTHIQFDADFWPDGFGFFETLRSEKESVFELGRHMRRAVSASDQLGIRLPPEDLIRKAIASLLLAEPQQVGRLRLLFSSQRFLAIHQSYEEIKAPLKVSIDKAATKSPISVLKEFPYTSHLEALVRAKSDGFDEVLRYNLKGFLTEGSVSNYLFRIKGRWITTPLSSGVLPGVMRAIALERCGVSVESVERKDVDLIESAIALSSLKLAAPVSELDGRVLLLDQNMKDLIALIREKTQRGSVG